MSSSDESEDVCPSPTNSSKTDHQIPEKSKERYIATYENFITWQKERNTNSFSEDVLMAYFEEIATKYKPSSLWAIYSMLKTGLKSKNGVNMDGYAKLSMFLRKISKGYVCKKAKVLTIENVEKFIDEAPDDRYLATKAALILGVTGGLRQAELSDITTNDIENHGNIFLVKIPRTKLRQQSSFVIQGKYYNIVKKYQSLRSEKKGTSTRFFQQFRNGKCSAQVIGKNKFGMMPKEIAEYLNLPDAKDYTGHSFRKASKTPGKDLPLQANAVESPLQDTDDGNNDAYSRTQEPEEPHLNKVQCRFCGEFSTDCTSVSSSMPYLAGNRTSLALNHLRIELDFSNDSLPRTVCTDCNKKLNEICEFVQQVNTAQYSLITVSQQVTTHIVKTEIDREDISITETEVRKTNKRKNVDTMKEKDKKKKAENAEFMVVVKEEVVEVNIEEEPEYTDTGTDVKPSEFELSESVLAYQMGNDNESNSVDQCNVYMSRENSGVSNCSEIK